MKKRQGTALILAVTLTSLLLLTAFALSVNSISDVKLTNNDKIKTEIECACSSGIKRAKAKIESSFNNNSLILLEPNVTFQGSSADDTGLAPEDKAFKDEIFNIGGNLDYYSFTYYSNVLNKDITVMYAITEKADWTKSQSYTTYKMDVESIAFIPGYGWVGMQQVVNAKRTTLFMYQVFFQNDLEILPGADFTLKGLIHTNENLYMDANSTLKIYTDSLTSAGSIRRGRLDSSATASGTVSISKTSANSGTFNSLTKSNDSASSTWSTTAVTNWAGTVQDSTLGATTLAAPNLKSFASNGYYADEADLKIEVNTSSIKPYTITINGTTNSYTSDELGKSIKEVQMYDKRESTSTQREVTEIDWDALENIIGTPDNGLVYMTSNLTNGFEITDGAVLDDATTIVTDMPVYVKGDFNLHTSTDESTDTWRPCAIIADAITLLSNSWVDSKSSTTQTASNTTYNFVFITGNVATKTGGYSGGLENFPRFLENWSSKTAKITGGFIQLFRSTHAKGAWNGSYYSPPTRNWSAESRFSDLTELPPDYANLFPSTNLGVTYSSWEKISKEDSSLEDEIH